MPPLPRPIVVLSLLLCVWEPANLALSASGDISAIMVSHTGHPIFLTVRILVASIGIAAGWALWNRRIQGIALAKLSLALSAATAVARFTWFPGNAPPGLRLPLAILFVVYNGAWFAYLMSRSIATDREETGARL